MGADRHCFQLLLSATLLGAVTCLPLFSEPLYLTYVPSPGPVVAADFNGDGRTDLAVGSTSIASFGWFRHDGPGMYTFQPLSTTLFSAQTVLVMDVEGDGDQDILVGGYESGWRIVLFTNDGYGTFGSSVVTSSVIGVTSLSSGDLNGDGLIDLVSGTWDDQKVAWYPNDGSGGFGAQVVIASGEDVTGVAVADLNGDGLPDVIASLITAGEVRWYANDDTQSFSSYSTISAGLNGPWSLSLSDLNNDGAVDVIVTVNYAGETLWLKNGGRGTAFTTHTISSDTPTAVSASAADVNGDSWPDVLVSTSSGALLFLGSSSGAFTESQTPLGGYCPNTLFAGLTSLDGDQYPDAIVSCTGNDTVLILHNRLSSPSPSPSASSSLSPSTTASETPAPSTSPAPYPQYFQWHVTPWSNCSCDANGDSWRTRDSYCVSSVFGPLFDPAPCAGVTPPALFEACTGEISTGSCSGIRWAPVTEWSLCSSSCGGGVSLPSSPAVCLNGTSPVSNSACASLPPPPSQRQCNDFPCPTDTYLWYYQAWPDTCTNVASPSGDVRSVRVRTVECVDPFGSPVSPTLCVGPAPAYTQPCVSGGGELDVCPLGVPRNSVTGACCAETTGSSSDIIYTLDANGECCAGTVDACGVCGGPSLFIDAAGICCPHAPLPSSGLCCASRVDSCGVCGGLDACGGSVSVELGGLHPDFEVVWSSFAFLGIGNDKVSNPHARPGGLESVVFSFNVLANASLSDAGIGKAVTVLPSLTNTTLLSFSIRRTSVCGNNVCEGGEPCSDDNCVNSGACPIDCPLVYSLCPVATDPFTGNPRVCAGVGQCVPVTGQCACSVGYSGPACSECSEGFARTTSGLSVCQPAADVASSTCYDGVQDHGETGVDCGGPSCPSARAHCPWTFHGLSYEQLHRVVLCVSFGVMVAGALLDHAFEVKGESGKRKGGNAVAPAPRQSVDRGRQQVLPDPDPNPSIARAASGLGRSQRQFLSDTSDSKSSGET